MAISVVFSSMSFIIIFAAKALYDKTVILTSLFTYDYITFLCVALMAGAAADYFNSPINKSWTERSMPIVLCVICVFGLSFVFHPFVKEKPDQNILKGITFFYCTIAVFFCGIYKSILFYEESKNLLPTIKF